MQQLSELSTVDVTQYPQQHLRILDDHVCIEVTYRKRWHDDFAARGWKLNAAIGDPEIIASTRETGAKIPTSVFIHDILDHLLCGFGMSGHRSEAMALIQLAARTGADPRPDYEQMIKEDIINGRVNGESLSSFLPAQLRDRLPADATMTDKQRIAFLLQALGKTQLIEMLVMNFFELGRAGQDHARESWKKLRLNYAKREQTGLALQRILDQVDRLAESSGIESLQATIVISDNSCTLRVHDPAFVPSQFSADIA